MSTIESAFLKANKDKLKDDHTDNESPKRKPTGINIKGRVSRNQIANMKQGRIFSNKEFASKGIVFPQMSDVGLFNKYRNLRTDLLATIKKDNFITLVTSAVPHGGASEVALNLAATFALDEGKTSLLINADIDGNSLSEILEIDSDIGLVDFLDSDNLDSDSVIFETPVPRLRYIPCGTSKSNTAEYFTSNVMKDFLAETINRYSERYPIIDAPSISESADTKILMELCDRVILVVPYGKCSQEEIKSAIASIDEKKMAGVVLKDF